MNFYIDKHVFSNTLYTNLDSTDKATSKDLVDVVLNNEANRIWNSGEINKIN